jgi:hypothetical protein
MSNFDFPEAMQTGWGRELVVQARAAGGFAYRSLNFYAYDLSVADHV